MEEKKEKRKLNEFQKLLYCSVFVCCLWMWYGSGLCATVLDQVLYVVTACIILVVPFVLRRWL